VATRPTNARSLRSPDMTFTCQTLSSSRPHSNRAHGIGLHMHSAAPSLPAHVLPSWLVKVISTPNIFILRPTALLPLPLALSFTFDIPHPPTSTITTRLHASPFARHTSPSGYPIPPQFCRICICICSPHYASTHVPPLRPTADHGHFGLCFDHHKTTDSPPTHTTIPVAH
jgi:hypothetical protein